MSAVKALDLRFENAEIVKKTGYSKSVVSDYLNPDSGKEPSENFIRKFSEQFGIEFDAIWSGQAPAPAAVDNAEPSPMQILDRLSKAFIDQAEGFKIQAHAFALHIELMKQIREEMARAGTQAIMDANLVRTLTGVEVLNQDSQKLLKMVKDLASMPKAHRVPLSPDDDKKEHQIGGDGKKPGKHRE